MSKLGIKIVIILLLATTSCISSSSNRERKNKAFTKGMQRMNLRKL